MGACGGACMMGEAMRKIAKELKTLFARLGKIRVHRAKPTLRDIPLLMKALSMRDREIAGEAHRLLCRLAGQDHGLDAARWRAWWRENRDAFLHREAEENAARSLFAMLRHDILTGDWEGVRRSLAEDVRSAYDPAAFSDHLDRSRRALREVYRDARVTEIRLDASGAGAALAVDWGRIVFDLDELPLVREPDGWCFARLPWTRQARHRPKPPVRYDASLPVCRRPWGGDHPGLQRGDLKYGLIILVALGALIGLGFLCMEALMVVLFFGVLIGLMPIGVDVSGVRRRLKQRREAERAARHGGL